MKEKYYVRLVGVDPWLPNDFVFGLSYDGSTITIGGPAVMKKKILMVGREVFERGFGIEHDHGRRFVAMAHRISGKTWSKGFEKLFCRFTVTPTRRFRRLMR